MNARQRLVSKIHETGPLYALQLLIERLVPKFVLDGRVVFLCELDLRDGAGISRSDPDIHLVEPEDLKTLIDGHEVLRGMRARLESGVRIWVLKEDDEIQAFMWLTSGLIQPSDWLRIELSEHEIAGVFLWVSPERRGRGLGPRMNRHVAHECARAGYGRIVSTVDSLNRNSLRADEKVGYQRIGKVLILRILGFGGIALSRIWRLGRWTKKHPLSIRFDELEKPLRGAG